MKTHKVDRDFPAQSEKTKKAKAHRPVVIHAPKLLNSDERKQLNILIKEILSTQRQSLQKLDALVAQYRDLIGYSNPHEEDWQATIYEIGNYNEAEGWLSFAEAERKRWLLEELQKGEA